MVLHVGAYTERRLDPRGRIKTNLERIYSSESKEFLKEENELTEISCGPDSTQWTKLF